MKKFFTFNYKGAKILVPIPEYSDDQKIQNQMNFGTEWGIMEITIFDGAQEHRITSNEITLMGE